MTDPRHDQEMTELAALYALKALGDEEHGIAPGTRWADVPDDFVCPECGVAKHDFVMMEA